MVPKYRTLLDEAEIDSETRIVMMQAAQRAVNMTGVRFSDAIRSEIADFQRLGSYAYSQQERHAYAIVRTLGY